MPEVDELQREIQNLRKELRGEGKPWYVKSPFKEILTHAAAVTTAVGIGLVVHKWTGEPITIEAKNVPAATESPAVTAAVYAVREIDVTVDEDAGAAMPAPAPAPVAVAVAVAPPRPKPVIKPRATMILPQAGEGELAYAPAAPAPAASVRAAPAEASTTMAAKKPAVITIGAVRTGD